MKKRDLIARLRQFVSQEKAEWKGQKTFALFFADWLEKLDIRHDERYDFWEIDPYIPQLAVDAFEDLRTGDEEYIAPHRMNYQAETGREVPNVAEMGKSPALDQCSAVQTTLGFMLAKVTDEDWLAQEIDSYANAQRHALQLTFDKFLRRVYRRGLYDLIRKCDKRGMSGVFGKTELRTYVMAGRVMFTFARKLSGKTAGEELSVSFVAEDNDPTALSAGIQSEYADLCQAMSMIEDVIEKWPADQKSRGKIYRPSKTVSVGF